MRNYKISRRNFLAVAGTLTAAAALTACGGSASSTVASSTASSSVASDSTPAAASGTGKVTVYMPSPAGLADKLAEGFTAKTGIEVEQFQGTTGEILARLEAEAANPVADVVILASWSDGLSMKADDKLESYTPENADLIVDGWLDDDSVLFGYSASAVGVIYNTTVFSTLDADWKDLGNAEYKDQLAIPDPEKSGACKDFVAGYVVKNGWDDFQAMADNGMTVPGANKAALEAVTTGEVGILVAGLHRPRQRVDQPLRHREIREALAQVDRAVFGGKLRHDRENSSAHLGQFGLGAHPPLRAFRECGSVRNDEDRRRCIHGWTACS